MMKLESLKLDPCLPPIWAQNGHAQTLAGHFAPSPKITQEKENIMIPLPDGDKLLIHFYKGKKNVCVMVFHGLGGSSESGYMHRMGLLALEQGCHLILVNHRGAGEGAGLAHRPYHSGCAGDISRVLEYTRKRLPGVQCIALGFSLSAAALLLNLTRGSLDEMPDAAIAVNGPLDLNRVTSRLTRGFNLVYDMNFVQECRRDIKHRYLAAKKIPPDNITWKTRLRDLDKYYTAPDFGFSSREDYYFRCSTKNKLHLIETPTIILTAKDDPIVDIADYEEASYSQSIYCHFENVGGHMGYISAKPTPLNTNRWMDYAVNEYLKLLIN